MKLLVTFLLASVLALAGPITGPTTVTLVNAGDSVSDGSDYVGPYTLAVDGKNYAAMCVDFNDESYIGASWTANLTDLDSSNFSKTYLGQGKNSGATYQEEAYLFSMLLATHDPATRIDIQHAAWYVTDPAYGLTPGAQTELAIAANNYGSKAFQATLEDFEIVSGINTGLGRQQEFIVEAQTPEPRSLAMIGAGLLIITGLLRKLRLASAKGAVARRQAEKDRRCPSGDSQEKEIAGTVRICQGLASNSGGPCRGERSRNG